MKADHIREAARIASEHATVRRALVAIEAKPSIVTADIEGVTAPEDFRNILTIEGDPGILAAVRAWLDREQLKLEAQAEAIGLEL